ncbi:cob(I)yrinic acid a,c-diamide adenosyltransferase [Candidatus Woesearchaeota archaeon]|nr:MAG: cob(I)yrinic acid a,c-diamide adenosyltransferase [Candidatus Woesearchaeota archaeon]
MKEKGITHVYTGDGKGKTTAALGMALRGCGYGMKTAMIQFIKGTWHYGELDGAKQLNGCLEIHPLGKGFVGIMGDKLPFEEHKKAAKNALKVAREKMLSGEYSTIILDEVHNAIDLGLISREEVLKLMDEKPEKVNLVLTGRNAPKEIIEKADLVSEVKMVKHYYNRGIKAIRGVEY